MVCIIANNRYEGLWARGRRGGQTPTLVIEDSPPLIQDEAQDARPEGLNLPSLQTLLGLSPPEILGLWGTPEEFFLWENGAAGFIGVRFPQGQTGFFKDNQLWMIRLHKDYGPSFGGLYIGISTAEAAKILKREPLADDDWILSWDYPGFPVNLRLIFKENALIDFYLYRTDY
jgi:hypothetical protein